MAEPPGGKGSLTSRPPETSSGLQYQTLQPRAEGSPGNVQPASVIPAPEPLEIKVNSEHHVYLIEREASEASLAVTSDSASEEEEGKENEDNSVCTGNASDRKTYDDDLSNKVKLIINLEGLKEAGGLLYIGCKGDIEKTNPSKIAEWFTAEFINLHRIYAIKEEEPFLLRIFTRNHESTNRGIRRKGGRKVMLMGQEVFGDVLLACGRCGYWSHEGSNVRRHLKKSVCLRERGYSKEDLVGLDRTERRKFLRRVAAKKFRAKKRAKANKDHEPLMDNLPDGTQHEKKLPNNFGSYSLQMGMTNDSYVECLVEIQERCCASGGANRASGTDVAPEVPNTIVVNSMLPPKVKRRIPKYKALTLGPVVEREVVQRVSYDIFTVNEDNERVAWKPPICHKASSGSKSCQIVFKGARMKRRCLDLPVPMILIYRKLDCKTHHCCFTLFHPSARAAFKNDSLSKATVNIKMYGDIVMTQEFYHYFISLLSIMKMKSSQTARHLTSVWETIIAERLGNPVIPEEHRKIITLSKQTVKSIWASIEEEAGSRGGLKLMKGPRRKKKSPAAPVANPQPPPSMLPPVNHQNSVPVATCSAAVVQMPGPGLQHHCMKRLNHIQPKSLPPSKPPMMAAPPPTHNHMQQPPHAPVPHTHWLGQAPQYPHNMAPYPMAPPPTAEYYPMPGHFMAQYTPATMGTSP